MTREIVLDTETTSTDPKVERIIEVGCVELINHMQTGTDVEAVSAAEVRFSRLLGARPGLAVLKDDAGRVVWTGRRPAKSDAFVEGEPHAAPTTDPAARA